ncbi:hypothetical protein Syun_029602 [Stephania yunnanensis]|uniref:Uncharacterized protein n=1 Tax=Stephania yunnanensis TaxID=152371 RepID=A0AAP0HG65_9MAGN
MLYVSLPDPNGGREEDRKVNATFLLAANGFRLIVGFGLLDTGDITEDVGKTRDWVSDQEEQSSSMQMIMEIPK